MIIEISSRDAWKANVCSHQKVQSKIKQNKDKNLSKVPKITEHKNNITEQLLTQSITSKNNIHLKARKTFQGYIMRAIYPFAVKTYVQFDKSHLIRQMCQDEKKKNKTIEAVSFCYQ